jgi:hypothetical protein
MKKYDPTKTGNENFPPVNDTVRQKQSDRDIATGDRNAKEQHERLKKMSYLGLPQTDQDAEYQEHLTGTQAKEY